jgi:GTP cyclohydrolase I
MALNKSKTDEKLGRCIEKYLNEKGVNTPYNDNNMSDEEKISLIKDKFKDIMLTLGLDLSDDSLVDTPSRVAKMFVNEIYWGLKPENFPKCTTVENKMKYDEMVCEKNITCISNCEHHFVTIDGVAHVAYIPKNKVLGLSKMNRIVEYFSRRPQIQERLTEQIYHALCYILETDEVAVVINAKHYCVKSRGVEDNTSSTVTAKLGGRFKTDVSCRTEFYNHIKM